MSSNETAKIVFDAGKRIAKADANIRQVNEAVGVAIKSLGLSLPLSDTDKATLETYRLEYMAGALASVHREDKARFLAIGSNAKDRTAEDKAILNAAGVNWLRIRDRAGLRPAPAKREAPTEDAPSERVPPPLKAVHDFAAVPVPNTRAMLELFVSCHAALLRTYDASASALKGDAAAIIRGAIVDMGDAMREAQLALAAEQAKDVTPLTSQEAQKALMRVAA